MTRTFIALEMNKDVQNQLAQVMRQLAPVLPGGRWVDPLGIHITLAFLGELNDERLRAAIHATQEAAQHVHTFTYRLSRFGLFGSTQHPATLWMGIEEPSGALQAAHDSLRQALIAHKLPTESRPFSPHLTLARFKKPSTLSEQRQLEALLTERQPRFDRSYPATAFEVIKSELSRSGPHYTVLQKCALMTPV
jgi:2'-5' RNA ligase